jgi:hypothetical protein
MRTTIPALFLLFCHYNYNKQHIAPISPEIAGNIGFFYFPSIQPSCLSAAAKSNTEYTGYSGSSQASTGVEQKAAGLVIYKNENSRVVFLSSRNIYSAVS